MIHVLVSVELQPGRRQDFLAEFHRIVPLVLNEQGCIEYGPAIDFESGIAAQAPLSVKGTLDMFLNDRGEL
ncbi:MAG: putative quinol monooxygenase, partial [Planctomycetota bacterium]